MIVITGAGRCGTSLIARTYAEAGEDIGGRWDVTVDAGYEHPDVVKLNRDLLNFVGASLLGRRPIPRPEDLRAGRRLASSIKSTLTVRQKQQIRAINNSLPWNRPRRLKMVDWSKADAAVERYAGHFRDFAATHAVVKDPQFALTLPLWIKAGAEIEYVVAMTRDLDDMIASRSRGRMLGYTRTADVRNSLLIANGTLFTCLSDTGVPHVTMRFPDLLADLDRTVEQLPTTPIATRDALAASLTRLVDPSKVRGLSATGPE